MINEREWRIVLPGGRGGGDKEKDGCKDVIYCGNISNERKILSSRK